MAKYIIDSYTPTFERNYKFPMINLIPGIIWSIPLHQNFFPEASWWMTFGLCAALRIGCDTLSKLVLVAEADLRELKELGSKTRDEILKERTAWVDSNLYSEDLESVTEILSELEIEFYKKLSEILNPIKRIYWRQLRDLLLDHNIMKVVDDFSLEQMNNDLIYAIISLDEFVLPLKNYFKKLVPDEIIRIRDLMEIIEGQNLDFDNSIIYNCLVEGKICKHSEENIFLDKLNIEQYLQIHESDFDPRNYAAFKKRLRGESLQEIGEIFGLTRERVRQILVKMAAKLPHVFEDYYRIPYESLKFSKVEFCNAFPECGTVGYEYLSVRYKKGNSLISEESIEQYEGIFKERLSQYWREECIRQDKKHVTRTEMIYRVLVSNSDCAMSMDEFEKEYNCYLERRNYPKARLAINTRTVSNHFRTAPHVVFDKDNRLRYCEADPDIVWKAIDFNQYRDSVISAELIYRDYIVDY